MKPILLSLFLLGFLSPVSVRPADWDSCQSDLEGLKSRADDAASKAEEVSDAEEHYKSCRRDEDGDCSSARQALESAKDDLESALDDVTSKVSSVSSSCGIDIAKALSTPFNYKARSCAIYHRYQSTFTLENRLLMCKAGGLLSDDECKRCLGIATDSVPMPTAAVTKPIEPTVALRPVPAPPGVDEMVRLGSITVAPPARLDPGVPVAVIVKPASSSSLEHAPGMTSPPLQPAPIPVKQTGVTPMPELTLTPGLSQVQFAQATESLAKKWSQMPEFFRRRCSLNTTVPALQQCIAAQRQVFLRDNPSASLEANPWLYALEAPEK